MKNDAIKLLKNLLIGWQKEQDELVIELMEFREELSNYPDKDMVNARLQQIDLLIQQAENLIEELETK